MTEHTGIYNKFFLSVEGVCLWLTFSDINTLLKLFSTGLVGLSTFMIIVINTENYIKAVKKHYAAVKKFISKIKKSWKQ